MWPSTLARVRRRILACVTALVFVLAAPATAQETPGDPGLAPAIGPWAGASRGIITDVTPGPNQITVAGVIRDPDSAQSTSYEVLVNGLSVASGATPRPDGFGRNAAFEETLRLAPGVHRICLRLDDRQLGRRTVNCRNAVTEPPLRVGQDTIDRAKGVAVSETGVVVPILGGSEGAWRVLTPCGNETTLANATIVDRARVVIDPGHGGSESGAVGGGLLEKNVNLVVSNRVIDKFEELGITAELTRTADYRVPIKTRADIATALAPDVFLSLHHNGGARRPSAVPGTEIFYAEGKPESQRLAAVLYEEMNAAAAQFSANWVSTVNQGASLRLRDEGDDLYGVHRFSPELESVITEFLYLSNPSEAALMQRDDVIDAEAQAIVDGILRWWFTADDGTTVGRIFVDSFSTGTGGFDECRDPTLNLGGEGLEFARADVLAAASGRIPGPAPARSLLPALQLAEDPEIAD